VKAENVVSCGNVMKGDAKN